MDEYIVKNSQKIYLVYEEISDQYGTSELRKAFKNKDDAEKFMEKLKRRSYIKEIELE